MPKGAEPGLSDMGIHALSISQGRSPNCKGTALKVRSVAVSEECGFETCPAADRWEGTREAESSSLVLSMSLDYSSVNFLMIIVILLVILLLVALTGFCVWRRKRKQSGKCGSPGGAVADLTPQREAPGSSAPALPPERGDVCACLGQGKLPRPFSQVVPSGGPGNVYSPTRRCTCRWRARRGTAGPCRSCVGWLLLLRSVGILGRACICLLSRPFLKVLAVWGGGGTVRSRSLDRILSGGLCSSVFAAFLPQR